MERFRKAPVAAKWVGSPAVAIVNGSLHVTAMARTPEVELFSSSLLLSSLELRDTKFYEP